MAAAGAQPTGRRMPEAGTDALRSPRRHRHGTSAEVPKTAGAAGTGTRRAAAAITPQQRESFRRCLREAQARLREELRFAAGASTEWEQTARGELEREGLGALLYERDASMAMTAQVRSRLVEIEAALERLDASTFGNCERCGHPIGAERLRAMPEARYCLQCARGAASPDSRRTARRAG